MELFYWIIDLLIPAMMLVMGTLFRFHPPKKINMFIGYRTSRSMASQEAWDYAHRLCGKAWMGIGAVLALMITADKLLLPFNPSSLSLFHAGFSIVIMILPIPFIEKRLKEKFGT